MTLVLPSTEMGDPAHAPAVQLGNMSVEPHVAPAQLEHTRPSQANPLAPSAQLAPTTQEQKRQPARSAQDAPLENSRQLQVP